jgi:hypothetical protein
LSSSLKNLIRGLEEIVPCSQNVTVIQDHQHMKDFYLSFKGREIYLPVELSTQMNGMAIFYKPLVTASR